MTDTLAIIAIVVIGSAIWFGIQTFVWWITLGRVCEYQTAQRLVVGALIAFPAFLLAAQGLRFLLGFSATLGEFVLTPVATAWILLLSWGGLQVAARLESGKVETPD